MTKIITLITFFICSLMSAQNVNLTVSVSGLKNNTGAVKVGLYNSDGTFLNTTYKSIVSEIKNNELTVTFKGIPKGEYGISTYHDENSNGKLDKNMMGIPSEAYACSNNARGFMGPPSYKDAKFTVSKDSKIAIVFN
ncbi:MAG: DUF2141 domain-containing protein [Flavobacterium circumlabens]|uniref:DUF2141 domain-containing protein n=1 Tax=Flavobacterium circumlabens TaxID=2133765 RepID=A0A4Y7UC48_9FLAO|nr:MULTISPECIES: DUF2141 domain-containing protein [Flavobacterium]MRX37978.1 DUF2141 domain-containing protein [Flavobacterium sp. LC2016-23]TCN58589.1 uncharacterized protein (DUF2141 family) [Flavobacterium circumlabens]TEB44020.1 DUF2141 domain-containing protein [Flavobacterium circumlabens]